MVDHPHESGFRTTTWDAGFPATSSRHSRSTTAGRSSRKTPSCGVHQSVLHVLCRGQEAENWCSHWTDDQGGVATHTAQITVTGLRRNQDTGCETRKETASYRVRGSAEDLRKLQFECFLKEFAMTVRLNVAACPSVASFFAAPCRRRRSRQRHGVQRMYVPNCGVANQRRIDVVAGNRCRQVPGLQRQLLLIRHAADLMLWDTGMSDAIAGKPDGVTAAGGLLTLWLGARWRRNCVNRSRFLRTSTTSPFRISMRTTPAMPTVYGREAISRRGV